MAQYYVSKDAENADRNNDTKWWMATPKVPVDSYYLMQEQGLSNIRKIV